jgi:hypothetical protein
LFAATRYGRTDQYIYSISQVLCVVEVKKTLSKADLVDGINHLADVQRHFLDHFKDRFTAGEFNDFEQARETYTKVTGRASPVSAIDLDAAPAEVRLLFSMFARQMYAPVTVLLGFEGYATEQGLREALMNIVEGDIGKRSNVSPDLFPSMISAGELSLIKCNGQPYLAVDNEEKWVAVASTRHNTALVLLEMLWTKISNFCGVGMPFGPEVDAQTLECVLTAKGIQQGKVEGWIWRYLSKSERVLKSRPASTPWAPAKLGRGAVSVAGLLAFRGGAIQLDQELRDYVSNKYNEDLDKVASELTRSSAFRRRGKLLQVIPPAATVATIPDGTGFAGPTGDSIERWCAEHQIHATFMTIMSLDYA